MIVHGRVFIWYGHPFFARAMETLLRPAGIEIVGMGDTPTVVIPMILEQRPDVVIADRIVEREHAMGIAELIQISSRVRVLVLDLFENEMHIYDRRRAEAKHPAEILHAIEEATTLPLISKAGKEEGEQCIRSA